MLVLVETSPLLASSRCFQTCRLHLQMMVKLQEGSAQKSLTIKEQKETINKLQTELAALRLQLHQKDQLIAVKDRQLDERGKLLDA